MSELSNSVIIPREDFVELQTAAFDNSHVPDARERVAQTLQTAGFFGIMAGAVVAATWGYATGVDWLEKRRQKRWDAKHEKIVNSPTQTNN